MGRVQLKPREVVEPMVARYASLTSNQQDLVAKEVIAHAKQLLIVGGHNKSMRYYNALKVVKSPSMKHGIVDRVIEVDRDAVGHIEFGHFAGPRGQPNRKWVNGLFILLRAAIIVGRQVR